MGVTRAQQLEPIRHRLWPNDERRCCLSALQVQMPNPRRGSQRRKAQRLPLNLAERIGPALAVIVASRPADSGFATTV